MTVGSGQLARYAGAGRDRARPRGDERGQAAVLLIGILAVVLMGALVLGGIARGIGAQGEQQHAADLAALAGGRALRDGYARLFEPARVGGLVNPKHLDRAEYIATARRTALATARRNGARDVVVEIPLTAAELAPSTITVTVRDAIDVGSDEVAAGARAEAALSLPGAAGVAPSANPGEYRGPYAMRGGKPMRPDTALAFDRMAAAARKAGITLIVVSGYRSDAEQAALFAQHPDPKWVAPPGTSLHRLGTELDLGPTTAYGWLAANAPRFGFARRYAWEPWHFGLVANAGTASVGYGKRAYDAERHTSLPDFVPSKYATPIAHAAQHWNVSGTLLAAQIYQESGFNPFARSGAGAQGIAQFMPGTASAYGLDDPYDATKAIDAQAHLMHDLLRQFASVPLALAAYNAGPLPVSKCMCVPPIPETQGYVTAILALLNGAGDPAGAAISGLDVRLVR